MGSSEFLGRSASEEPRNRGIRGTVIAAILTLQAALSFATDPFPLAQGTTWVYRGTLTSSGHVRHVTTTMRIVQNATIGRYEVAIVDGEPASVSCVVVKEPRHLTSVIIRDGNRYYGLVTPDPSPIDDEYTTEDDVAKALEDAALMLEIPLHGKTTIGTPPIAWTVEELGPKQYRLTFSAIDAEREIVDWEEGVGMTRWRDLHQTDGCSADFVLVGR